MFEEFSAGYYLGQLYVEPRDGERAVLHEAHHERANETVYASGEGVERLDHPLVMKLDSTHFPVHRADDVPTGTLAVPDEFLEAVGVQDPPALKDILLAKADQASQLMQWFGANPGGDSVVSL